MLVCWPLVIFLSGLFRAEHAARAHFGLTGRDPLLTWAIRPHRTDTVRRDAAETRRDNARLCDDLKLEPRQRRLCARTQGMARTLVRAAQYSILECRQQFRYDRWNCTLGQYMKTVLKKGFRETAFAFGISSAGLVHAVGRACSLGHLERCTCDQSLGPSASRDAWRWGGCGDNIRYAHKFARRFLRSRRWGKDPRAKMDRHNSRVGRRAVRKTIRKQCKCHGVSGSCSVQTCWKQFAPFHEIGARLKRGYDKALHVTSSTNSATGENRLVGVAASGATPPRRPLNRAFVFTDKSPSYCQRSGYSPGTPGRLCQRRSNCGVMCCGRGYDVQARVVRKSCNCRVIWCCYVKCQTCVHTQDVYTCK